MNHRDFIVDLFCPGGKVDPWMHAGHVVMEHGYSFSMVQENYLDSRSDLHKAFAVSDKKVRTQNFVYEGPLTVKRRSLTS